MGLFDSLGSLFSSGTGAASAGPSWASMLGPLISSIHATPNAGATKGDMARASRINLLTGILGGLAGAYGQRQQADAQSEANAGLLDILSKGGGERMVEAQGPTMPGMSAPQVSQKIPMSEAFASYGRDNPLAMNSSLKLALDAQANERADAFNQRKMDLEQSRYSDEQGWKEKTFNQNAAHLRAMEGNAAASLGLQRQQAQWQHDNDVAMLPYKQMANERAAYGDDVANELMRARMGAGGSPKPEVDDGKIGGFTPNRPAAAAQTDSYNVAALMDGVAAKKASAAGIERLDKINNDPALRSATEEYRKGRQAIESVAELINTGELSSMDRQMVAKRLVQSVEPGLAVGPGEGEAALTRLGTTGVYLKNWLDDMFGSGTRLGPEQIKRALDQLAVNVGSQRRSALDFINNKRQYGAATGVTQEQLPLIGNGFVDGGDPSELASKAWSLYQMGQQQGADPDLLSAQRALFKKRYLGGR